MIKRLDIIGNAASASHWQGIRRGSEISLRCAASCLSMQSDAVERLYTLHFRSDLTMQALQQTINERNELIRCKHSSMRCSLC